MICLFLFKLLSNTYIFKGFTGIHLRGGDAEDGQAHFPAAQGLKLPKSWAFTFQSRPFIWELWIMDVNNF